MVFEDVLEIKNGRNQKAVENPEGKYPIYGSGGVMGYADDYICEGQTVVVGRKGSINNPLYVEEPFWNVDTAFGLCANKEVLLPRYLYYFCRKFDFERLNKAVTIPSLTKSDLLKIEIDLPDLSEQQDVIDKLLKVEKIIEVRKQELQKLDDLVKARFVELFGDYHINDKGFETHKGSELFKFSSGKFLPEENRLDEGIPVYGGNGIAWYTDSSLIDYPTVIIGRVGAWCGNVHMVTDPVWITDNAIYIKEQKTNKYTLEFLTELMKVMDFHQYADFSGQPKITQKPLETLEYLTPPVEMQNDFTDFVHQVDKSKVAVQKALDEAQLLFDSLMQEYFG